MSNYPVTGYYRFFMQNDGPGLATKYATANGLGFQVTADRTDGLNHERQRVCTSFVSTCVIASVNFPTDLQWYVNASGANVVFYKEQGGSSERYSPSKFFATRDVRKMPSLDLCEFLASVARSLLT
jgi:hypothetical protein